MMRIWIFTLLLTLHIAASILAGAVIAANLQKEKTATAHTLLRRIASLSSDERYIEHLCRSLKKRLIGPDAASMPDFPGIQKIISRLNKTNCGLWLFDGAGRLVHGAASDAAVLERAFKALRNPWYERSRLDYEMFPGSIHMLNDVYWLELLDCEDKFSPVNTKLTSGWGYWTWCEDLAGDAIAGILAIVEKKALENDAVIRWVSSDLHQAGVEVGWFNRQNPLKHRLPRGITPAMVDEFERRFLTRGEDTIRIGDMDVAVAAYRDHILLLRVIPIVAPQIPAASWILLMIWVPLFIRWALHGSTRAPALSSLLAVAIGVAGVLPFCLSVFFWRQFAESRTQAISASLRQELEQRLVRIDQKFPALIERLAARYRRWCARFEAEICRDGSPPTFPEPNPYGLEIKSFATDTVKAGLVSETYDWEENGTVDTIFLADQKGVFWRQNSDNMILFRRMSKWPRERMFRTLGSLYERRTNRAWQEYEWVLSTPLGGYSRLRYLSDNVHGRGTAGRLASQLVRAVIAQYNVWMGIDTGPGGAEEMSTLATTGMMDSTFGGDIVSVMLHNLGDFTISWNEAGAAAIFVHVIRGATGAVIACISAYHYSGSLSAMFFEEIMSLWPNLEGGMRLYAVSNFPCTLIYPGLHDDRKFSAIFRRLEPPNVLMSEIVTFEGKRAIMAALNCRQIWNYHLVGILPWNLVQERVRTFQNQLLAVAFAMSLVLIVLCLMAWGGIVNPVAALLRGVDAMEAHRLEHRISISTGDELERLAETFNETLAGMEELEVAKIVQRKLLPEGEVASTAWRYRGVSVMCSEVGGDYHDACLCEDGSIAFILGDVSGHGVSAALVVAMAKAAFGTLIRSGVTDPGKLLVEMNGVLFGTVRKLKMMTAVTGLAKPDGSLLLANAGHCYPALLRRNGEVELMKSEGSFPLGVRARGKWNSASVRLSPGDRLLLYTDGIPEASDRNGQQLDYDRWHEMLIAEAGEPDSVRLIANLHERLRNFTNPVRWADDVTLAIISRCEPDAEGERTCVCCGSDSKLKA